MAENDGNRIGSCDSENGNKRLKSSEEEDRFSALPDSLIHRILSLLPATDLVKTLILSKWWNSQWTHVPVLNFVPNDGTSPHKFSNFIDETLILHDCSNNCSNIDKFAINLNRFGLFEKFPNFNLWIRYAVSKDVKELIVNFNDYVSRNLLPDFVFNNSSLVTLELYNCHFMPIEKVNWGCVKSLCLYWCHIEEEAIANVLSGSPLLEHLDICGGCHMFEGLVIASKSLKTLILDADLLECRVVEISCPNLERLRISSLVQFTSLKLINLPSSVYASLDFYFRKENCSMTCDHCINLVQQILRQVQHIEKLEIGRWMMEILSASKEDGDCIGGLPDDLIHRIISFLPSTKDAFEGDFFKTLHCKWTHDVPVLNFVCNEKLVIDSKGIPLVNLDPRLSLWIRFAARKDLKELILDCDDANVDLGDKYSLPQFLFNNSSLVKMKIHACDFMPNGKVNWESLKSLHLQHCELGNEAIENVLSGSPLLECLELHSCGIQGAVVIASQHLKKFLLDHFCKECCVLEISCPNLEMLIMQGNVGSTHLKFMNLPSSVHAILDLYVLESDGISSDDYANLFDEIMKQMQHVEGLEIKLRRLKS